MHKQPITLKQFAAKHHNFTIRKLRNPKAERGSFRDVLRHCRTVRFGNDSRPIGASSQRDRILQS